MQDLKTTTAGFLVSHEIRKNEFGVAITEVVNTIAMTSRQVQVS